MKGFFEFDKNRRQHIFFDGLWNKETIIGNYLRDNNVPHVVCEGGIVACAEELRFTSLSYDLVILHTHPEDMIPALAFGYGYHGPPVALFDHAVQYPWLVYLYDFYTYQQCHNQCQQLKFYHDRFGGSVIDFRFVYSISTHNLAEARGLNPQQDIFMPLLARHVEIDTEENIRKELMYLPKDVIIFVCAHAYKFGSGFSLLITILSIVKQYNRAHFVGIGIPDHWESFARDFGVDMSKIRLYAGDLEDATLVHKYHTVANIHVGAFPFLSPGSALESGMSGAVVIGVCPWENSEKRVLCLESEDYGHDFTFSGNLSKELLPVMSCDSFNDLSITLSTLLQHSEVLLPEFQMMTKRKMKATHEESNWLTEMEKVYAEVIRIIDSNDNNNIPRNAILRDNGCFLCQEDESGERKLEVRPVHEFVSKKTRSHGAKDKFPSLPCLRFLN